MSFASFIVRKVTGSLKFGTPRTKLEDPWHEDGKLRDTNIAVLHNPRFTKEQFEKLTAKSTAAEHSAGQIAGDLRFRR
jgi:hypothetical protein